MRSHAARLTRGGVALWVLGGLAPAAWAADAATASSPGRTPPAAPSPGAAGALVVFDIQAQPLADALVDFDIPAQPLADALNRYALLSSWPILFQSAMVAGRTSSAIRGPHSREAALRRLLEGTGLIAEKVDSGLDDAYVLKELGARTVTSRSGASKVDFDYGGWVQAQIWQALCADPRTAPGGYRSLLRFRVDAAGRIQGARMFRSTGDVDRDAAILATLQGVRVDRPPPPGMAQPLTMLVLPREPGGAQHCAASTPTPAGRPEHG